MSIVCPSCATENPPGFRFCGACAAPLQETPAAREERKVVTVLFADLVGFTSRAERMDPEEVRALQAPYFERVRAELERFGGTVEKFIGDAVMALFGAPVTHEDDPERAVRAALAVRDALEGELSLRIGITTGEALITLGARPERGEGMAAGDVVNTAARLQAAADSGGILVDETTYRATDRTIEYVAAAPVDAKGKSEPLKAWQAKRAFSRLGVDVRHATATPLVGRGREQTLLTEALERVKEERAPQLVTLVGVPGIGKSRLVWELFRHIEQGSQLVTWRQGRSLPYGEGVAFWGLGEIVKAQAGILDTDGPAEAAAKLDRAVRALVEDETDAAWVTRHLRPLAGLDADADTGADRSEAFAAWRRFVESLAEQRPLVLVFEDLHFADDGLLDFVDHVVDWASGVPLLVVGTARPELLARRPSWGGGKPNAVTISLSPLSDEETARVVHALLDRSVLDAQLQQTLLERAGGNPLYAEEFARIVAAGREPVELPETVQGIVAARLDLLSPEEKSLLHDAAVIGKVFWLGTLEAMSGNARWTVEQHLHALERKEFVRRERTPSVAGEIEFAFRHILVRDVAYGQIPRPERGEKHCAAAAWIESLGRPEDHAEMLAHHYLAALELAAATGTETSGFADRARRALRDSGDRALALYAHPSAVRFYEAALELWPNDDPELPELLFGFGRALLATGDERADGTLQRARDALVAADAGARGAEASAMLAELSWHRGQPARSREHLDHALALVDAEAASASKAWVLSQISRYLGLGGETEAAVRAGREAAAMAEALGLDEVLVHALTSVGTARSLAGAMDGLRDLERAVEIGLSINSPEVSRAYNNWSSVLAILGHSRRSRELRHESVKAAERFGNPAMARFSRSILLRDDYESGNWDAFIANAREFLAESERLGGAYQDAFFLATMAEIGAARGELEEAVAGARRALEVAREVGDPQVVLGVLEVVAGLEADAGDDEAARMHAKECFAGGLLSPTLAVVAHRLGVEAELRALAEARPAEDRVALAVRMLLDSEYVAAADVLAEMENGPVEARVRLRAAEQLVARGGRAAADEQLARALAFWRRAGATRYVREAERLLAATA